MSARSPRAASRGAARVEGHLVVGVLPDEGNDDERQSTAELDLAVFTGMGKARNVINVLSADVVVAAAAAAQARPQKPPMRSTAAGR